MDEKKSPQKLGGDFLSYNWTPSGSGRPTNAFSQAFDNMHLWLWYVALSYLLIEKYAWFNILIMQIY